MKNIRVLLIFLVSIFTLSTAMAARPTSSDHDQNWHFILAPYGWLFGQVGDITIGKRSAHVDVSPIDILNNFHIVDAIFQLYVEVKKERAGVMANSTYVKLTPKGTVTTNTRLGPIISKVSLPVTISLNDLSAYYSVLSSPLRGHGRWIRCQLLGGVRYVYLRNALLLNIANRKQKNIIANGDWTDPLIGARLITDITSSLSLLVRGDYAFGHKNHSWSVSALLNYAFNHYLSLSVGYKVFDFTGKTTSHGRPYEPDITFSGPGIGLALHW